MIPPNAYMLEFNDIIVGILVVSNNALIFFASDDRAWSLDRCEFRSIGHAQCAVRSLFPSLVRGHSR